jgi:UMP-CMP kinase
MTSASIHYYPRIPDPSPALNHPPTTLWTTMAKGGCENCTGGPFKGFCPFSLVLFTGTAISYVRYIQSKTKGPKEPFRVVFVLGGPGAGKGTQCEILSKNLHWAHLSAGDLLRAERQKEGSELADIINSNISAGKIVPSEITVQLIKNAMLELWAKNGQTKFLIDGFPRSEGNVNAWKDVVGDAAVVERVLFFECPEDVLTSRLLERGKTSGRNDDSIVSDIIFDVFHAVDKCVISYTHGTKLLIAVLKDVIRKRFATYRDESIPIIEMYKKEGKVNKIIADRSIDDVYKEVESLLKD